MKSHKNDLSVLSKRQLLSRRRAAAARLGDVEQVLAGVVRRYLRRGEQAESVLAEISAINAELLARRELR